MYHSSRSATRPLGRGAGPSGLRLGAQEALEQPAGFAVPYVPILGVLDLPCIPLVPAGRIRFPRPSACNQGNFIGEATGKIIVVDLPQDFIFSSCLLMLQIRI